MTSKDDCIFCKIVRGKIPSSVVYEDDVALAFMDIFPVREGHCLLIPKEHYENMFDVKPEVISHLGMLLAKLTKKVHAVTNAGGVINIIANGASAGQEVPHLHLHMIPRNKGDAFGFRFPDDYREAMAPRKELDAIAAKIREA